MILEVLWRQLVGTGSEHLILNIDQGILADSMSVGEIESAAYRVHYEITCGANWQVERVRVENLLTQRATTLVRDEDNRWRDEQAYAFKALDGCTDVDIMITPFTNTLPIRTLNLKPGESKEIAVVYFGLPDFVPARFEQRYTCLGLDENGGLYRYENIRSAFTADLKVDSDGLVIDYPVIFVMEAKRQLASS
jgi:uncharacterized protein